ncbi:hypothetical protein KCP69_02960 [Salmonella enterica subsp. enterica]|nr:hypothetical protein KCP69_02960 [Salmonella enterica subsp. enterica]
MSKSASLLQWDLQAAAAEAIYAGVTFTSYALKRRRVLHIRRSTIESLRQCRPTSTKRFCLPLRLQQGSDMVWSPVRDRRSVSGHASFPADRGRRKLWELFMDLKIYFLGKL